MGNTKAADAGHIDVAKLKDVRASWKAVRTVTVRFARGRTAERGSDRMDVHDKERTYNMSNICVASKRLLRRGNRWRCSVSFGAFTLLHSCNGKAMFGGV